MAERYPDSVESSSGEESCESDEDQDSCLHITEEGECKFFSVLLLLSTSTHKVHRLKSIPKLPKSDRTELGCHCKLQTQQNKFMELFDGNNHRIVFICHFL